MWIWLALVKNILGLKSSPYKNVNHVFTFYYFSGPAEVILNSLRKVVR